MNFWCFPWEHMCIAEGNADKANTFKDNKLPQGESRLWWSLIHTIVKEKGKKPYRNVNNMVIDEMRFKERKCIDEFRLSSSDELIESLRLTNYFPRKNLPCISIDYMYRMFITHHILKTKNMMITPLRHFLRLYLGMF